MLNTKVVRAKPASPSGPGSAGVHPTLSLAAGSLRGDYALEIGQNLVHGSDSPESAKREIDLFFPALG